MIVRAAWCPLCRMGTWQAQYDAVGEWGSPCSWPTATAIRHPAAPVLPARRPDLTGAGEDLPRRSGRVPVPAPRRVRPRRRRVPWWVTKSAAWWCHDSARAWTPTRTQAARLSRGSGFRRQDSLSSASNRAVTSRAAAAHPRRPGRNPSRGGRAALAARRALRRRFDQGRLVLFHCFIAGRSFPRGRTRTSPC